MPCGSLQVFSTKLVFIGFRTAFLHRPPQCRSAGRVSNCHRIAFSPGTQWAVYLIFSVLFRHWVVGWFIVAFLVQNTTCECGDVIISSLSDCTCSRVSRFDIMMEFRFASERGGKKSINLTTGLLVSPLNAPRICLSKRTNFYFHQISVVTLAAGSKVLSEFKILILIRSLG